MKCFLLSIFITCVAITTIFSQKEKPAYKYISSSEDTRKDEFPDLVKLVKVGKLENDFVIEATDKSFKLEPNKQFIPKSFTNGYVNVSQEGIKKKFKDSKGTKIKVHYNFEVDNPEYNAQDSIGKLKPKKIRETGDMYGIIEFNKVWEECSDQPNTRAYYINISPEQIEKAKGGKINTIYEYYKCKVPFPGEKLKENTFTSFVLWLSDIEF
jgi:hypothetical protein